MLKFDTARWLAWAFTVLLSILVYLKYFIKNKTPNACKLPIFIERMLLLMAVYLKTIQSTVKSRPLKFLLLCWVGNSQQLLVKAEEITSLFLLPGSMTSQALNHLYWLLDPNWTEQVLCLGYKILGRAYMWMTSRLTIITIIQKPAQIPTVYGGDLDIVRKE